MPETDELDLSKLDLKDEAAVQRLRDAYERQATARAAAEAATAEFAAKDRTREVQDVLRKLNAPETVASVYPVEGKVDEDSIRTFLKDKIGMEPDKDMDAWRRYDNLRTGSEPPAPHEDEQDKWIKTEMDKTEEFYRRTNYPTPAEEKELDDLKSKVTKKLAGWDQDVQSGKMEPIFNPQGFGGFLDPPSYARRARNFVSLQ